MVYLVFDRIYFRFYYQGFIVKSKKHIPNPDEIKKLYICYEIPQGLIAAKIEEQKKSKYYKLCWESKNYEV